MIENELYDRALSMDSHRRIRDLLTLRTLTKRARDAIRWLRSWRAWWTYRKAIAAYEAAAFYRRLATQCAEEGEALERQSTVIRNEIAT